MATHSMVTPVHKVPWKLCNEYHNITNEIDIIIIMEYFARWGNTRYFPQLVKNGPKYLWLNNHLCIRSELRAKLKAAIIRKILKGMPGVTTPM